MLISHLSHQEVEGMVVVLPQTKSHHWIFFRKPGDISSCCCGDQTSYFSRYFKLNYDSFPTLTKSQPEHNWTKFVCL